jgi:hypothetical protein
LAELDGKKERKKTDSVAEEAHEFCEARSALGIERAQ